MKISALKSKDINWLTRVFKGALLGLFIFSLTISTQCAVSNVNHLATTNWVDRKITPDNHSARWALIPVYIPVTFITLIIDNFIIAPLVHIPSAFDDTGDFWQSDMDGYYANMGVMPIKLILTPVVFTLDWLGRTVYAAAPEKDVAWAWPEWGQQWQRNKQGKLIAPMIKKSTSKKTREKEVHSTPQIETNKKSLPTEKPEPETVQ